ncbi:hypothetical protein BJY00DRAFT_160360 [Aspergillus carlsbadensis]|nr:hypothetical protein BJY00DRAFT_160360 [Aspergillus carlsbadensis]
MFGSLEGRGVMFYVPLLINGCAIGIDIRANDDFVWTCPKGGAPKCCYTIGKGVICSTEVGEGEE